MNAQRGGYTRGTRPSSPGNLTAKIFNQNQARAEAAKRAKDSPADAHEIRKAAYLEGHEAGFTSGWDAGVQAAMTQFREAGIDVDAVLALDDEPDDAEDA